VRKSYKILTTILVAGAVIAGGGFVNSTLASQDEEKLATKAAQEYVSAFKSGNIDKLTKSVKDTRVTDQTQLKAKYEKYVKKNQDRHSKLDFVRIKDAGNGNFSATFEISSDLYKATQFDLPVVTDNGQWKVFVDGSVVVDTKK
jgi:hypothetical protein